MSDLEREGDSLIEGYREAFRQVASKLGPEGAAESAKYLIDYTIKTGDIDALDPLFEAIEGLGDEDPPKRIR